MPGRSLKEKELLDLYESCLSAGKAEKAFLLLSAVHPDKPLEDLAKTGLGDRDRSLWDFRKKVFGRQLDAKFQCHECEEWLEISLGNDFQFPAKISESACVKFEGKVYEIRLPICQDIIEAGVRKNGFDPIQLCPDGPWQNAKFRQAAAQAVDEADPALDISFSTTCSECDTPVCATLDISDFLWADLAAKSKLVLSQIAILASRFGWTENDCLSLTSKRRALYLEIVS